MPNNIIIFGVGERYSHPRRLRLCTFMVSQAYVTLADGRPRVRKKIV